MTVPPMDVHAYYRQVTDIDIGEIARELLAARITQESPQTLVCDCPNHRSQSHRSLHVSLEQQCWLCWGCGVGGDVLHLVEFVQHGVVTKGQTGQMPESHRAARDFLAARVGLPPLSKLSSGSPEDAEKDYQHTLRVREALTALAEFYHQRLMANAEVLGWFRTKYGIGDEAIARLKIGFAEDGEPSAARALMDGAAAFAPRELTATSAFRPTAQDGIVPFFDRRIVFPYWSRGLVVFMIGRRTPWTPEVEWEKSKYKKLAIWNEHNNDHVAPCIRNDVLYNEDVLLTRPERVIITEGVTDCISLMEHGFPAVSPVTVQIREADWERLLPKLRGVKTVFVCQDNEVSQAGMQGALKTAHILAGHGIATRVAVLPLSEKQRAAREKLVDLPAGSAEAGELEAAAKIDVNEFFADGHTAADFEAILASAQTPLELAISKLDPAIPDADLSRCLEPILAEISGMAPIERERHFRLIQTRCGKSRVPVSILRQQVKVVVLDDKTRRKHGGQRDGATRRNSSTASHPPDLPAIQINDRQLREIVSDAWTAVHCANLHGSSLYSHTPFLFQRAGRLVRLATGEAGPQIDDMDENAVFGLLARTADWHKAGEESITETSPPRDAARDMLAYPDLHLPVLEGVISSPIFGRKGEWIVNEGYHPDDRVWLWPDGKLDLQTVPDSPGPAEIAAARELLFDDLLVDFPFVDASDRAHAVAAMILPFIRRMIDGPTPMHLIEAPTMGSGKGLLVNLVSIVATGTACEGRTLPENEDELRKMLTAELMKGRPMVLLDNANDRKQLRSSSLASVLTSVRWTDRKLGESTMATVPNAAVWMMTANNPNLHLELARRCIRVRIDPRVDRPWKRTEFKHPEITAWARENRSALVGAVLTMLRAWMAAGSPLDRARLGSFERWTAVIGGILNVAGISGFLANLEQFYEAADQDGQAWRAFTAAWWEAFRDQPKKVSDLNQFCEERELMLKLRGDGSVRSQQTRLGNALGSCRDRSFDGLRICRITSESKHKGVAAYALAQVDSEDGGPWGPGEDLGDKGPQSSSTSNSTESELFGDLGDLEDITTHTRGDLCTRIEDDAEYIHSRAYRGVSDQVPNVPNVPNSSVNDGGRATCTDGPATGRSPQGTQIRTRVDLADFDDGHVPPDGSRS